MLIPVPRWMVLLPLGALALPATGAETPLWEAGLGAGVVSFAEYRGSSRQRTMALPVPYFVYRGEFLQANRNGLRGKLFDSDRVKLNLSLAASLPVDSSDHGPRRGMPDLQPTVEFGPSLEFGLWRGDANKARLNLNLPVRAAYTVRGGVRHVGMIFSPA
ncbi:MAG: MipA/OmpV family protein, partial [Azoarcus sp.]|nr:MipA/OmpV family protein [Azoarcus sp.]